MDAILVIILAIVLTRKAVTQSTTEIEKLPIGKNPKGYYDSQAFTQVYLMRRGEFNEK